MDVLWLDVSMWTGLRGDFLPFTDVACDPPDPAPRSVQEWQEWAAHYLAVVAEQDGWQAGRYHYTAERRDDDERTVEVIVHGHFSWDPQPALNTLNTLPPLL